MVRAGVSAKGGYAGQGKARRKGPTQFEVLLRTRQELRDPGRETFGEYEVL